ncbi:hypothetical protein RND81_06G189300 [Saponaria officinalis]|uniref:Saposin B-type domain-containing protein n=1 Tax=Saponaria officinalis TaxID=3572 RepID=A0AAW1K8H4_SAPOF
MAKKQKTLLKLIHICAILSVFSCLSTINCLKKQEGVARKEDIPFIKCQVCEKLASEVYSLVQKKESQISPKKISEYQIIEIVENVCNLKKEEGDWILKIDIVEQGDKLKLVDQDVEGVCNSECKTIERACQEVMGYSDTDVAEYIYARKPQLDSLVNYLCKDLTKACSKKPPPVPKDRIPGEEFMPKPTKEAEMEKMMRSMEGLPGAPGMKMYSRDELMNMQNGGGEDDDADEDDDDEDSIFKSNVGKALREKAKKEVDWKEKVVKHVTDAGKKMKTVGKKIKTHAIKVKLNIQKWWRSKNSVSSKKKSTTKKAEL